MVDEQAGQALGGFEAYVLDRSDALWRSAWLLTGDAGHAQDLVQTALAKTWSRYAAFDNDRHFESYVRTTMYRTFCSWWRRSSWRTEVAMTDVHDRSAATPVTDVRMDVLRALDSLPRIQRAVLTLRFFEDRSVAEVAELLRLPANTVKTHTRRALIALRDSADLKDLEG